MSSASCQNPRVEYREPTPETQFFRDACAAWQSGRDGGSSPVSAAARVLTIESKFPAVATWTGSGINHEELTVGAAVDPRHVEAILL